MSNLLRSILFLALPAVLLVACGGSGDANADSGSRSPTDTARKGYFTSAESDAMNPVLVSYNEAIARYDGDGARCADEAARLFEQGASPRRSVRCHFELTDSIIDPVAKLRTMVAEFDRTLRPACARERDGFVAFMERYEAAWKAVREHWERYAGGATVTDAALTRSTEAAEHLAVEFTGTRLKALSTACYTRADLEAAAKGADEAED